MAAKTVSNKVRPKPVSREARDKPADECHIRSSIPQTRNIHTASKFLGCVAAKKIDFEDIPGIKGTQPWFYRDAMACWAKKAKIVLTEINEVVRSNDKRRMAALPGLIETLRWAGSFKNFAAMAQDISYMAAFFLSPNNYLSWYDRKFGNAHRDALSHASNPNSPFSRYQSRFLADLSADAVVTTSVCEIMPRESLPDVRVGTYMSLMSDGVMLTYVPALSDPKLSFGIIHATRERVDDIMRVVKQFGLSPITEQMTLADQMRFAVADASYNLSLIERVLKTGGRIKVNQEAVERFDRMWAASGAPEKRAFVAALVATLNYQQTRVAQNFVNALRGIPKQEKKGKISYEAPTTLSQVLDNLSYYLSIDTNKKTMVASARVRVRLKQARENYESMQKYRTLAARES